MNQPQESGKGVIKVKLLRAGRVLRSYKVRSDTFTIGTAPGSTIRAAGDPDVRPTHATLYIDEGELTLVPEPNAVVLLNGEQIDFAIPSPDDLIRIGKLILQVELVSSLDSLAPQGRASRAPKRRTLSSVPSAPSSSSLRETAVSRRRPSAPSLTPVPSANEMPASYAPSSPRKTTSTLPRPSAVTEPPPAGRSPSPAPRPSYSTSRPAAPMAPSAPPLPQPSSIPPAPIGASVEPKPSPSIPLLQPDEISTSFDLDEETKQYTVPDSLPAFPKTIVTPIPHLPSFPDVDADYFFGEEDEETFVETFDLATVLLSKKRATTPGPKEPYSVAHVIRVVNNMVKDAFGVIPDSPYETIDGELRCYVVEDTKSKTNHLFLEAGPTISGEIWTRGQKKMVGGTPSFRTELADGDSALLTGQGGTYKIEVYRPPLAPKRGQLFSISYPMLVTVLVLALALHGAAAYALRYIQLDRIGDISQEEEEVFAEVVMEKPDTPKPPEEQVVEEVEQDAKSIAERAPKVSQRTIRKRIKDAPKQQKVSSLLSVLTRGSGKAGESNKLKDLISNIDAVASSKGSGSSFSIAGAIASLPGNGVNIARSGGGGAISTLSGDQVAGKGSGLASLGKGTRKGKVRGKVTKMSSGAKIGGSLSREDVLRVINSNIHAIQACYERALMNNPALSGRIAMDWTVATTGRVKSVRVRSSTIGSPQVASCISGVIKRWKFPRPKGGEANITFPFLFRSGS